jgi:hypothetical protein
MVAARASFRIPATSTESIPGRPEHDATGYPTELIEIKDLDAAADLAVRFSRAALDRVKQG